MSLHKEAHLRDNLFVHSATKTIALSHTQPQNLILEVIQALFLKMVLLTYKTKPRNHNLLKKYHINKFLQDMMNSKEKQIILSNYSKHNSAR